jgi:hypothetical protein
MFLTRLPCPGWCDHHPAFLMRSMMWFPLLGAMVGAWGAAFYNALQVLLPRSVAAALSTLATVWLTGGCGWASQRASEGGEGGGGAAGLATALRAPCHSCRGTTASTRLCKEALAVGDGASCATAEQEGCTRLGA